jgi:hypothetical protein
VRGLSLTWPSACPLPCPKGHGRGCRSEIAHHSPSPVRLLADGRGKAEGQVRESRGYRPWSIRARARSLSPFQRHQNPDHRVFEPTAECVAPSTSLTGARSRQKKSAMKRLMGLAGGTYGHPRSARAALSKDALRREACRGEGHRGDFCEHRARCKEGRCVGFPSPGLRPVLSHPPRGGRERGNDARSRYAPLSRTPSGLGGEPSRAAEGRRG